MHVKATRSYVGSCHCGAIGFTYRTEQEPSVWSVRACQCSFCRAHHVRSTSDPKGEIEVVARHREVEERARFFKDLRDGAQHEHGELAMARKESRQRGERQHSLASMNRPTRDGFASSVSGFPYGTITAPVLHVHNENDACPSTPYSIVKEYAGENLLTVRGGVAGGDPCGGTHLHSYQGREEAVVRAIISWIKTGKVDRVVGE